MREKLQTLPLTVLREFAKDKHIKNITVMRKADLIEAIIKADEEEKAAKDEQEKTVKAEPEQPISERSGIPVHPVQGNVTHAISLSDKRDLFLGRKAVPGRFRLLQRQVV